ncbi:MAG: secondary thiamine-phosphate synthase enzyme YjbQ [Anaerolineales bacterium]
MQILEVSTKSQSQFVDITDDVSRVIQESGMQNGLVVVYIPHTTAGIVINEHADPSVAHDVLADLDRLVPWEQPYYEHAEGNSSSHVRASIVGTSEMIVVEHGALALGTWQGIFLCEFDGPRRRKVYVKTMAD